MSITASFQKILLILPDPQQRDDSLHCLQLLLRVYSIQQLLHYKFDLLLLAVLSRDLSIQSHTIRLHSAK